MHSQSGEHHSDPRSSGAERGLGLRHHRAETQSELCLLLHAINPVDRHYGFVMIMYGLLMDYFFEAALHRIDSVCVPCLRQHQHHLDNLQITGD